MTRARLGIVGHPVAHSLSPAIQGAALRAAGIDATYERWMAAPPSAAKVAYTSTRTAPRLRLGTS